MTHSPHTPNAGTLHELRRYSFIGGFIVVGLLTALAVTAGLVTIDSAITATGRIAVMGGTQDIAHPTGGVVASIAVQDGSVVQVGDTLLELRTDEQDAATNALKAQLVQVVVRVERIRVEEHGKTKITLPASLSNQFDADDLKAALAVESRMLSTHAAQRKAQLDQAQSEIDQLKVVSQGLDDQRRQLKQRIASLNSQIAAQGNTTESTASPSTDLLLSQQELQTAKSGLADVQIQRKANAASLRGSKSLKKQLVADQASQILTELETSLQLQEQLQGQVDALATTRSTYTLRAPVSGIVFDSAIDTVGGVVLAGATIMKILPASAELGIEVAIGPTQIDSLHSGTTARVLFSGLAHNPTPEAIGTIDFVAPDTTTNPATGGEFYVAHITIAQNEWDRLPPDFLPTPGMPVEVFVETGDRSILSYLLQPLIDRARYALREE